MPPKHIAPSISAKSFSCPHCGALADQQWYTVLADRTKDGEPPTFWNSERVRDLRKIIEASKDRNERDAMEGWIPDLERRALGLPYLHVEEKGMFTHLEIANLFGSYCHSCKSLAVWRHDELLYPPVRLEIEPNLDLAEDIRVDFNEARTVFAGSPRAAAALLRLCVQKLCKQLGMPGKKIDDDIGALVAKGLPVSIQQALDLVRVIGNNAVHPGTINLNDDRGIAAKLFELINIIADNQISQPKAIAKLFDDTVPPGAKAAIAKRDAGKS